MLDLGLEHDLVQKSGSFFSYGELRLGQGRNNSKQYLAEHPELADEIEGKIYAALGIERPELAAVPAPPADGRSRAGGAEAEAEAPAKAAKKAEPKQPERKAA